MENQFSKIILGTVQLGMPYGLGRWANDLMPENDAFKILDVAFERGITTLDTSPDYGLAEARIARYLTMNPDKHFHILSKIKNIPRGLDTLQPCFNDWIENCPFIGLTNCNSLSLLLHREDDLFRDEILNQLNIMIAKKHLFGWGVSVYGDNVARLASTIESCAFVQLPFSALNQAFGRSGAISLLSSHGKSVMARSVFLQGLMLQSEDSFYEVEQRDKAIAHKLFSFLQDCGASVHEFAMSIALAEVGVSNLVLGVDTHEQLSSWSIPPDPLDRFELPGSLLGELRYYQSQKLNPQFWKKHAD